MPPVIVIIGDWRRLEVPDATVKLPDLGLIAVNITEMTFFSFADIGLHILFPISGIVQKGARILRITALFYILCALCISYCFTVIIKIVYHTHCSTLLSVFPCFSFRCATCIVYRP